MFAYELNYCASVLRTGNTRGIYPYPLLPIRLVVCPYAFSVLLIFVQCLIVSQCLLVAKSIVYWIAIYTQGKSHWLFYPPVVVSVRDFSLAFVVLASLTEKESGWLAGTLEFLQSFLLNTAINLDLFVVYLNSEP